ncbi:RNA-binding protein 7 [Anopheles marshallii]|uniref:RNA-binding protein 7 n=1 Tax=Anopheles marshallii TaxID=1521116 RepID=UPI00237B1EE7|nr:RNA-binding protein 7 [Anopheles marshallii]
MSEEERTLWCGNLSENVTEEILYELFLQAGPLENIKIPRDADRRQRSYAFITFQHACSVEYAMNIFEGTALLQRPLTLHRKARNGSNASNALAQTNFNYPMGSTSTSSSSHTGKRLSNDVAPVHFPPMHQSMDGNAYAASNKTPDRLNPAQRQNDIMSAMSMALNGSQYVFTPELLAQLGQQLLGAELPPMDHVNQQQSSLRTKIMHNDRSHYRDHHHKKPYSRDDRYDYKHDRNDSHNRHRYDSNSGRKSNDYEKDKHRNNRSRR